MSFKIGDKVVICDHPNYVKLMTDLNIGELNYRGFTGTIISEINRYNNHDIYKVVFQKRGYDSFWFPVDLIKLQAPPEPFIGEFDFEI